MPCTYSPVHPNKLVYLSLFDSSHNILQYTQGSAKLFNIDKIPNKVANQNKQNMYIDTHTYQYEHTYVHINAHKPQYIYRQLFIHTHPVPTLLHIYTFLKYCIIVLLSIEDNIFNWGTPFKKVESSYFWVLSFEELCNLLCPLSHIDTNTCHSSNPPYSDR